MLSLIASLVVLLMQKQMDIQLLYSLGLSRLKIQTIFIIIGTKITALGCFLGCFLGVVFCFLQDQLGLIKLGENNTLLIDAYPIKINGPDIITIIFIVFFLGVFTSYLVAKNNKFYHF